MGQIMAPMKVKATTAKAMTKGALVKAVAEKHELKTKACSEIIDSLVEIATTEVKKTGIFTLPGLCRLKLRTKPATKAGVRNIFGKDGSQSFPSASSEVADLDQLQEEMIALQRPAN